MSLVILIKLNDCFALIYPAMNGWDVLRCVPCMLSYYELS